MVLRLRSFECAKGLFLLIYETTAIYSPRDYFFLISIHIEYINVCLCPNIDFCKTFLTFFFQNCLKDLFLQVRDLLEKMKIDPSTDSYTRDQEMAEKIQKLVDVGLIKINSAHSQVYPPYKVC